MKYTIIIIALIILAFSKSNTQDIVKLITPQGGERFINSDSISVEWINDGINNFPINIYLWDVYEQTWNHVGIDINVNLQKFKFKNVYNQGKYYRIKITYNASDEHCVLSSNYFAIRNPLAKKNYDYDTFIKKELTLYPNPVNNFLYLISDNYNKYEIIDLNGLVISEGNFKSVIDMSNVNSGIYFIRFYFENDVITKKIIKE